MTITRHFVRIGNRRVHYRRAGEGPVLLMVHQSPRSSAEYISLIERWSRQFTCIAPDTPGFGQSDPLPGEPGIGDFADALLAFMSAIGIDKTAAYGFHSGGIILVSALRRAPERFSALAIGGYAVWTPAEMEAFGASYLPPFQPSAYGEHLTWLWNRILEQSWFFPWFDTRAETRLSVAHDDPLRVDAVVREMLDSGDAYRAGYGAVLRAPRDIPAANDAGVPVLISAYDGDPLQAHLARLGQLPEGWRAEAVGTPAELETECFGHLKEAPPQRAPEIAGCSDLGFASVAAEGFSGLIHWRGNPASGRLLLHTPGRCSDLLDIGDALAIDLPGHGLSDGWADGTSPDIAMFADCVAAAVRSIVPGKIGEVAGEGPSALLAAAVAARLGARSWRGIAAHVPLSKDSPRWMQNSIPDLAPDRFGSHLARAWSAVRAAHFFWPWFDARAANAIPFEQQDVAPDMLAREHRSLMRAHGGAALLAALLAADRDALVAAAPPLAGWHMADWAGARTDLWKPVQNEGG